MNLNKFLRFGNPSQLLVCETDGFSLRGAVLARVDAGIEVLHQARIEQVAMADAVADLVAALKSDGWSGGGAAILLSPAVLSTLMELPVNPKKPRPVVQMLELVRWEVEPLLMQHMTRWSVGHLLVGQGYMTEKQAQAVMDMQQGKPNAGNAMALTDKFSLRRFGDLAEEMGFIKRSQLNACLTGQEWLKADDEQIECGWTAQGAVEDIPGSFNWLVGCVNKSLLQRWTDVFARQGIKLKSLYPLTGCSTALSTHDHASHIVLESHPGMAFATRLVNDQVVVQQQYLNLNKTPLDICLEIYHALHAAPNEALSLACWHEQAESLITDLQRLLAIDITLLNDPTLLNGLTPGMAGAARHALGLGAASSCVDVRFGGPLPPLPQRQEVRAAAALGVLLVSMLGTDISLWIRKSIIDDRKQEADARWKVIDDATKRINAQIEDIKQRKLAIAQKKADLLRYEAMLDFYNTAIPERVTLVQGVLSVLQNTVDNEVIIFNLSETDKAAKPAPNLVTPLPASPPPPGVAVKDNRPEVENFSLSGWAISEASAQTFIQKMKEAVAPWQLEVRDAQVSSSKGPLNLEGFAVSMRLVKLDKTDNSAAQPGKGNPS